MKSAIVAPVSSVAVLSGDEITRNNCLSYSPLSSPLLSSRTLGHESPTNRPNCTVRMSYHTQILCSLVHLGSLSCQHRRHASLERPGTVPCLSGRWLFLTGNCFTFHLGCEKLSTHDCANAIARPLLSGALFGTYSAMTMRQGLCFSFHCISPQPNSLALCQF